MLIRSMVALLGLAAIAAVARADVPDEPFEDQSVCVNERGRARDAAAARVGPAPSDAPSARVERARRDLAGATGDRAKLRPVFKRWLDEAIAEDAAGRAAWRADVAKRDATRDASAKALVECMERERSAYLERVDAKHAEEQRKADEEAAKRERMEMLMSSKPIVQLALSALVCVTNNERAAALRAIADEKKYARIGGVQNNAKIYGLQQAIREADQRGARFSRELKVRKASAIKCSDPKVKQVATCWTAAVEEGPCLDDDVAGPLQVVRVFGE